MNHDDTPSTLDSRENEQPERNTNTLVENTDVNEAEEAPPQDDKAIRLELHDGGIPEQASSAFSDSSSEGEDEVNQPLPEENAPEGAASQHSESPSAPSGGDSSPVTGGQLWRRMSQVKYGDWDDEDADAMFVQQIADASSGVAWTEALEDQTTARVSQPQDDESSSTPSSIQQQMLLTLPFRPARTVPPVQQDSQTSPLAQDPTPEPELDPFLKYGGHTHLLSRRTVLSLSEYYPRPRRYLTDEQMDAEAQRRKESKWRAEKTRLMFRSMKEAGLPEGKVLFRAPLRTVTSQEDVSPPSSPEQSADSDTADDGEIDNTQRGQEVEDSDAWGVEDEDEMRAADEDEDEKEAEGGEGASDHHDKYPPHRKNVDEDEERRPDRSRDADDEQRSINDPHRESSQGKEHARTPKVGTHSGIQGGNKHTAAEHSRPGSTPSPPPDVQNLPVLDGITVAEAPSVAENIWKTLATRLVESNASTALQFQRRALDCRKQGIRWRAWNEYFLDEAYADTVERALIYYMQREMYTGKLLELHRTLDDCERSKENKRSQIGMLKHHIDVVEGRMEALHHSNALLKESSASWERAYNSIRPSAMAEIKRRERGSADAEVQTQPETEFDDAVQQLFQDQAKAVEEMRKLKQAHDLLRSENEDLKGALEAAHQTARQVSEADFKVPTDKVTAASVKRNLRGMEDELLQLKASMLQIQQLQASPPAVVASSGKDTASAGTLKADSAAAPWAIPESWRAREDAIRNTVAFKRNKDAFLKRPEVKPMLIGKIRGDE